MTPRTELMQATATTGKPNSTRWLFLAASTACVALGVVRAIQRMWIGDDAFITFRYARNWVDGLGLVYNAGERVEGYTNFLWTLWAALGLRLGIDPVAWTEWSGVTFYAAAIALLAASHLALRGEMGVSGLTLPAGAMIAAVHADWAVWATGGLETSCFAFLVLAGCLLSWRALSDRGRLGAGVVLGLASLARPDGALFAAIGGVFVLVDAWFEDRRPVRQALIFAAGFTAVWLPHLLWRYAYYGELLPNTYYAKSAYATWYAQGWIYLRLFYAKSWVLALALPAGWLALLVVARGRHGAARWRLLRPAVLATAMAAAYTVWVVRVGGDFMYARLLVPTLPLLALAIDAGSVALGTRRGPSQAVLAVAVPLALLGSPDPVRGAEIVGGVTNEPEHYGERWQSETRRAAEILRRYFNGLHVVVAFSGSEARLMYEARIPVAIEAETGLTDRFIARQPLERRGRVGHEKHAPLDYLLRDCGVHFTFKPALFDALGARDELPQSLVYFDGVRGLALRWDPELMAELGRRGARFEDFPSRLDRFIPQLERMPRSEVNKIWQLSKRFYFDHVDDPRRRAAFERLLRADKAGG